MIKSKQFYSPIRAKNPGPADDMALQNMMMEMQQIKLLFVFCSCDDAVLSIFLLREYQGTRRTEHEEGKCPSITRTAYHQEFHLGEVGKRARSRL